MGIGNEQVVDEVIVLDRCCLLTPPTAPLLYLSVQLNGATVGEALGPTLKLIIFAWMPTLLLTTYVPDLALWLPRLLLGGTY